MSAPRVSVIVPAYRSEERIGACVEGLADQGFTAFEVVVVNSSEEEPTRARVAHGCPQARFVQSPTRLLPHDARNVGACRSAPRQRPRPGNVCPRRTALSSGMSGVPAA